MNRLARFARLARMTTLAAVAAPALGLGVPAEAAHAEQNLGTVEFDGACAADGSGWVWLIDYHNPTSESYIVDVYIDGQLVWGTSVEPGLGFEQALPGGEDDWTWVSVNVNNIELDGAKDAADCLPPDDVSATIALICPTEQSPNDDILLRYDLDARGSAATFDWSEPSGSAGGSMTVIDEKEQVTYRVENGDAVNAWIRTGKHSLASLTTIVDCPPLVVEEEEQGSTSTTTVGSGAGSPTLPQTGANATATWLAVTLLGAGLLFVRLAARGRRSAA